MTDATMESPVREDGALVDAARKMERGIGKAKETVTKKVSSAKDGVKEGVQTLKSKSLGDLGDGVKTYVKDNPGTAVAISLGVGLLAGMLIARR